MKFSRQYFDVEAYAAGKHCGSTKCKACESGVAVSEYCESQGEPSEMDIWVPLCHECKQTVSVLNWRDAVDTYLRSVIDFKSIGKPQAN